MADIATALAWTLALAAIAGIAYALHARSTVGLLLDVRGTPLPMPGRSWPPVSLLRPLHGAEPDLRGRLQRALAQDYAGRIELVLGLHGADDGAFPAADAVRDAHPDRVRLVVDGRRHGGNGKVDNLINMRPAAAHDVLILADSDIETPPDYVRRVVESLEVPGVGAVTLPYRGVPAAPGVWAELAAAQIDHHFLPSVLVGLRLGLAEPCMGSTIALRRDTLDRLGGFERFRNDLADDHALGAAVRELGLGVAVPAILVGHVCPERSLGELWRHELRWQRTIRRLDPGGHAGSLVTHPLPLSLLALALSPGGWPWLAPLVLAAGVSRHALRRRIDHILGRRRPWWVGTARDLLSFAVFVASFPGRRVNWRGVGMSVTRAGKIDPA